MCHLENLLAPHHILVYRAVRVALDVDLEVLNIDFRIRVIDPLDDERHLRLRGLHVHLRQLLHNDVPVLQLAGRLDRLALDLAADQLAEVLREHLREDHKEIASIGRLLVHGVECEPEGVGLALRGNVEGDRHLLDQGRCRREGV